MTDQTAPSREFILYTSEATIREFRIVRIKGDLMKGSVVLNFQTTAANDKLYHIDQYNYLAEAA